MLAHSACVRVCVRACIRACVRVCVRASVRACVRACVQHFEGTLIRADPILANTELRNKDQAYTHAQHDSMTA